MVGLLKPFIVPGVCRYTVHATFGNRAVANVLDYEVDTTGELTLRSTACEDMAGILLNEWTDSILPILVSGYVAQSITWVDLDDVDGTTGSRSTSGGNTWPKAGTISTSPMPANVAYLVRKNITGVRSARRGRMYLCGVDENATAPTIANQIDAAKITTVQTKMNSFLGDTNQTGPVGNPYHSHLTVVRILERYAPEEGQEIGSPKLGDHHNVTSLQLDTTLATQRRRLRG